MKIDNVSHCCSTDFRTVSQFGCHLKSTVTTHSASVGRYRIFCNITCKVHTVSAPGTHRVHFNVFQFFIRSPSISTCMENLEMSEILTSVRLSVKRQGCLGNVREKILSRKSGLKLFIISHIFAFILDFAEFVHFILVLDHVLLHSYPHH